MKKNLLVKALIWTIAATVIVLSMDSAALRAADLPPAEEKQIEALIATIERMSEAAFIRNGQPYVAAGAAEFCHTRHLAE